MSRSGSARGSGMARRQNQAASSQRRFYPGCYMFAREHYLADFAMLPEHRILLEAESSLVSPIRCCSGLPLVFRHAGGNNFTGQPRFPAAVIVRVSSRPALPRPGPEGADHRDRSPPSRGHGDGWRATILPGRSTPRNRGRRRAPGLHDGANRGHTWPAVL